MLDMIQTVTTYCKAKVQNSVSGKTGNVALVTVFAALMALVPEISHAQPIADTLCAVINELSGPVGRGIAAIAVIFLGFSLFLGKVSWGLAVALAIGIAAIFGAPQIVDLLGGGVSDCGTN